LFYSDNKKSNEKFLDKNSEKSIQVEDESELKSFENNNMETCN
jgi:hypothetical protein